MDEYWSEFLTVMMVYVLALISPGPDCALIIKTSLFQDLKRSYLTSLGTACAVLVHAGYCLLGAGVLIASSPRLNLAMRVCGATYLIYLGWQGLKSKAPPAVMLDLPKTTTEPGFAHKAVSPWKFWSEGFVTALLNPKGIFFILSLFTQVIHPDTPMSVQLVYVLVMFLCSALWFSSLSFTLIKSQKMIRVDQVQYYALKFMGVVMIGLGIKIGLIV